MQSDLSHVETFMREGGDQVMFTQVYSDGHRSVYWLPFWRACWHAWKLMFKGVTVKEMSDAK